MSRNFSPNSETPGVPRRHFFRKLSVLVIVVGLVVMAGALTLLPTSAAQTGTSGTPGAADKTALINFSDLARQEAQSPPSSKAPIVVPFKADPGGRTVPGDAKLIREPVGPTPPPAPPSQALSPTPATSFQALDDNNASIPPDTHGTVGPNHVMTTLNTQVRIQNRSGGIISTVTLDTFWASVVPGGGVFDPKILYDPFNNRWMFTAAAGAFSASSSVLMGVSQTSDPTGIWKLYSIDGDATDTTWADYPSMGFNKNWIVVQMNMFNISGAGNFSRSNIYVLDKANLYAFGAGTFSLITDANGFTMVAAQTYDNTLDTMYLLQDWNGNSGGSGFLRLSTITGAVNAPVLNATSPTFPTATGAPWAQSEPFMNFAPQSGSAQKIENNDSRMQNVVYRNGSLWAAHGIFLPAGGATRSSVQWWQINPTGTVVTQRSRIDDPTGVNFFGFPTIAVNKNNDALIAYSHFSASIFAEGSYSFRYSSDPLNTLQSETVLKAGEASYFKTFSGVENRWGDYSNTVVDPVNDVDMWTIQEYAATLSGGFDRWSTWWGRIVLPASITATAGTPQSAVINTPFSTALQATVRDASNNPVSGVLVTFTAPGSGPSGTFPGGNTAMTNASGQASVSFTANGVVGGPYNVTVNISPALTPAATFALTNTSGAPVTITATAGTPQSALINTPFATQLQATVRDASSNPVSGTLVTFTAPGSGASGTFPNGNTATTNANGQASVPFTANGAVGGPYNVTANITPALPQDAIFVLTNTNCDPLVVNISADTGSCGSFRAAINQANSLIASQSVTISFNVTSSVLLTSALPAITNSGTFTLTITGGCTTESVGGVTRGIPGVTLSKSGGFSSTGLSFNNRVVINGLAIIGFTDYALDITGNNNVVTCSRIGTLNGTTASANGGGVRIAGSNNRLGNPSASFEGNLISGNSGSGIQILSGTNNQGYYNWIGLQKNGTTPLGNGGTGTISLAPGAHFTLGRGNRVHN